MTSRRKRIGGVTFIELIIVVVIVGILAGVAYPSYLNSVRKSRRAEGMAALATVELAQQKLRASCQFYGQGFGGIVCGADGPSSTILAPSTSENGRYNLTLSNATPTSYTVTATAVGDQANDKAAGVTCTLVLTVNALNPNGLRTPAACWN